MSLGNGCQSPTVDVERLDRLDGTRDAPSAWLGAMSLARCWVDITSASANISVLLDSEVFLMIAVLITSFVLFEVDVDELTDD